ncbi:MAG: hypothetical protein EBU32_01735 [Opitutaceae bacterium]|nr:hypothetical protein [Opitutaceae bacterium]
MKFFTRVGLVGFLSVIALALEVRAENTAPNSRWAAVENYVEAATAQMSGMRTDVEKLKAAIGEPGRRVWAELAVELAAGDQLVGQLRGASLKEFDVLKAKFERLRLEVGETIVALRKTSAKR